MGKNIVFIFALVSVLMLVSIVSAEQGVQPVAIAAEQGGPMVTDVEGIDKVVFGEYFELEEGQKVILYKPDAVSGITVYLKYEGPITGSIMCKEDETCPEMEPMYQFVLSIRTWDAISEKTFTLPMKGSENVGNYLVELVDTNGETVLMRVTPREGVFPSPNPKPVPPKGQVPVCSHVGTVAEGWYLGNELVQKATCVCRAVCKVTSGGDSAFYSTCTGKPIMRASCSPLSDTEGPSTPIEMYEEVTTVASPTVTSQGKLKVTETSVTFSTGTGDVAVMVLPSQAEKTVQGNFKKSEVHSVVLDEVDDAKAVYTVTGVQYKKFLVFNWEKEFETQMDATTGEIIE